MRIAAPGRDERGLALILVIMLSLAVAVLGISAAMISQNASLTARYSERQGVLGAVADAGLERGRSLINGTPTLYPDSDYTTLENGVAVTDASGGTIAGVRRWTWVGPIGVTTGQYGVFGSVVSLTEDPQGNRVVRRNEVVQESFAKYAYFTDVEPSNIYFLPGDRLQGPVHSNDLIKVLSPTVTFQGPVSTARTISNKPAAVFQQGYTENAGYIALPQTAQLTKLSAQATTGGTRFTGTTLGAFGQATTRIEFMAIDLNGDGDRTDDNEGFIRVYQLIGTSTANLAWLNGDLPTDYGTNYMNNSVNCGHWHTSPAAFVDAASHPTSGPDAKLAALSSSTRRCYLGGSDSLFGGFVANDGRGQWLQWGGAVSPLVAARSDASYLFPISRALNPSFKGVIYVQGNVGISGVLRGQVTVAATGNIVILDDMRYATDPGAAACGPDKDMLGLFAGVDVIVANNSVNAPTRPSSANNWFTYDETSDEFVHGVVLALNNFTAEGYNTGATTAEACGTQLWGRGCLFLSGGIIQRTRGAVSQTANPGGTGYIKRYSYDVCAAQYPPPYFPTTGHFTRGRYFDVDPSGFSETAYFNLLQAGP